MGFALLGLLFTFVLVLEGLSLNRPATLVLISRNAAVAYKGAIRPADFTPVANPPPAFVKISPVVVTPLPKATPGVVSEMAPEGAEASRITPKQLTPTTYPLDTILAKEGRESKLRKSKLVTILLLGTDARPDEQISRTDSLIVAILNLDAESVTFISIPRDLWVVIAGYGQGRINTAYFLGETSSNGPEVARQTVAQVLGIPIDHDVVINFDGFRRMIDALNGINLYVPDAIDEPLFPDKSYGTYRLLIPEGYQHMDGELALAYARTRHGNSDIYRAQRQQAKSGLAACDEP